MITKEKRTLEELCNDVKNALTQEAEKIKNINGESIKNIKEFLNKIEGLDLPADEIAPIIVSAIKDSLYSNITSALNSIDSIRDISLPLYLEKCRENYKGDKFDKLSKAVITGLTALRKEGIISYNAETGCFNIKDAKFEKIKIISQPSVTIPITPLQSSAQASTSIPTVKNIETDIEKTINEFQTRTRYLTKLQIETILEILTDDSLSANYRKRAKVDSPPWKMANAIGNALNYVNPENIDEEDLIAKITYFNLNEKIIQHFKNDLSQGTLNLLKDSKVIYECKEKKIEAKREVDFLKYPHPDFREAFLETDLSSNKLKASKLLKENFYSTKFEIPQMTPDEEKIIEILKGIKLYEELSIPKNLNGNGIVYKADAKIQSPEKIPKIREFNYKKLALAIGLATALGLAYIEKNKIQTSLDYLKYNILSSVSQKLDNAIYKINQFIDQK
ncbi:MAG: hypothetical protein QW041_00280 [Candidatus Pacearchaeota archaeon]